MNRLLALGVPGGFSPLYLRPKLWLDAWYEAWRRGLSAPVLVDGFNRADGSLGSAPTGQAYSVVAGTWTIASGTARTAATDANAIVLFGTTMADGRITLRTRTTATASVAETICRYIDSSNFIEVVYSSSGLLIRKKDGGSFTMLASGGSAVTANVWNVIEVRFTGAQIDVYVNGTLTAQYTLAGADLTKFGTPTSIGLGRNGATSATVEYDDITVSSGASSALLDTWADSSGNGFDFSQATATKQPMSAWVVAPSGILVPAGRGDGVDDIMAGSVNVSGSETGTVYIATRPNSVSASQDILTSADEATATHSLDACRINSTGKLSYAWQNGGTVDLLIGDTSLTQYGAHLFSTKSDGGTITSRVNGVSQSLSASTGANSGNWFADATGRDNFALFGLKRSSEVGFYSGDVFAALVFDRVLADYELSQLDRYFNARYGMGISL